MTTVFSKNNPVLAFNDLKNQTDEDEQMGMMYLYAGAGLALKNLGSHAFPDVDSPDRALELVAFLSLLAKRADEEVDGRRAASEAAGGVWAPSLLPGGLVTDIMSMIVGLDL